MCCPKYYVFTQFIFCTFEINIALKGIHFLCLGEINILHLSKCEKCMIEIPNELLVAVDQRRPHNTMAKIKGTNEQTGNDLQHYTEN